MLNANEQEWKNERLKRIGEWEEHCPWDDFIDEPAIWSHLNRPAPSAERFRDIVAKARDNASTGLMLPPEDVAALLNARDPELWEEVFATANRIKQTVYGDRIVLFAPLYLSSSCVNNCAYCGFRASNESIERRALNRAEVEAEVRALVNTGHKRVIAVYGEHPESDADYICRTIEQIYSVRVGDGGEIRRCNVNAAPMFVEEYRKIKQAGIGTYQIFQETYHRETYRKVHPANSLKGSYRWRQFGLHRAFEGGIDDVAIGVLFGLYDWRFEVMGLLYHAMSLEKEFGIGPHTISYPRMVYAENSPLSVRSRYLVGDEDFKKIVAVIRLMCPYTGSILTAREAPELRHEMIVKGGVSQMDAGTRIGIGGYSRMAKEHLEHREQFMVKDSRSLDEFIHGLCKAGHLPSFCTAGYRQGRTGAAFMPLAKHATVNRFCIANGMLTFREYLDDYASPEVRKIGETEIIPKYLAWVREHVPDMYGEVEARLVRTENHEHDLRF